MAGQEEFRGVFNPAESRGLHGEYTDFLGGSEPVFPGAKDAEIPDIFSLEEEHRIHNMLQHHRPGNGPRLGDMAYQDDGDTGFFTHPLKKPGAFPNLGHAARGAFHRGVNHGLDGINHHQRGIVLDYISQNAFHFNFRQYKQVVGGHA